MVVELRKRDADILSYIIADYLDNMAAENNVTKQCELLLAKLGHYNKVEEFHRHNPHPSLEDLLEGGVKSSVAKTDVKAMNNFHNKLEIIDAAFKSTHQKRIKTKALRLSEILGEGRQMIDSDSEMLNVVATHPKIDILKTLQ